MPNFSVHFSEREINKLYRGAVMISVQIIKKEREKEREGEREREKEIISSFRNTALA